MARFDPPAEDVLADFRRCLTYNPETGALRWREMPHARAPGAYRVGRRAGQDAGTLTCLKMRGRRFSVSRVCWYLHNGEWPDRPVFHRDGDSDNHIWTNLYIKPPVEKAGDATPRMSKYRGVRYDTSRGRWIVAVSIGDGREKFVGRYASEEAAAFAYDRAAWKRWGSEAKLNFPAEAGAKPDSLAHISYLEDLRSSV